MTTRTRWILACVVPLAALCGCVTDKSKLATANDRVTPQMRSGSNELLAYQIQGWIAPDDRTLIMDGPGQSVFEARFRRRCSGLRLVDTIAFIVPGAVQIDKYSGVVLPDGTHCDFGSLTRLSTESKETPVTENP